MKEIYYVKTGNLITGRQRIILRTTSHKKALKIANKERKKGLIVIIITETTLKATSTYPEQIRKM